MHEQSVSSSHHLPVRLSACLPARPPACLSACLPTRPPARLPACLPVCVSASPQLPFCHELVADLTRRGIRAQVASGERLGKLIRNAETQKVPVMGIVGAREVQARSLNVRTRKGGELGALPVDEVVARIEQAVADKAFL